MGNKRAEGGFYEREAAKYLTELGWQIREMNFRGRRGEIDIIAEDGETIVFLEVKARLKTSVSEALSAVTSGKQRRISETALFYMVKNRLSEDRSFRFDVIGFGPEGFLHVKNAFPFCG